MPDAFKTLMLRQDDGGKRLCSIGTLRNDELPTTVMPCILRNVSLRGADSAHCPVERRKPAWQRLVTHRPRKAIGEISRSIGLGTVAGMAERITNGRMRNRVIVDPNA